MAAKTASAPLPVAEFLQKAASRNVIVSLSESGDSLVLEGPEDAITPRICEYVKAAKPDLIAYLREQEQKRLRQQETAAAKKRAALVAEFGEALVAEGLAVEADLQNQRNLAEAEGYDDYGDHLQCAHQAAAGGRMGKAVVLLSPGREVGDPGFHLLQLIQSAKLQRQAHGEVWRQSQDGQRIESDIRAIVDWYAPPL